MSSDIKNQETRADEALRILEESLAYYTAAPTLVRDGAAPRIKQDRPERPKAA